ncbi:hypothetical protein LDENG_00291570, partial [Lucifuga dentata]
YYLHHILRYAGLPYTHLPALPAASKVWDQSLPDFEGANPHPLIRLWFVHPNKQMLLMKMTAPPPPEAQFGLLEKYLTPLREY